MSLNKQQIYNFNDPIFKKKRQYIRYAKEHMSLMDLHSDVIQWEVKETTGPLKIPIVYRVHYYLKSIVGVDEHQQPIYGDHHIMELTIPPRYPIEPCKIYMVSDVWHPNIKSKGKYKGKICGNVKSFGKSYDLYQLVLRVGEILQYKNYHAEHTPPYPEDSTVAAWVMEFGEPNDIVNQNKGIIVDDTPLLRADASSDTVTEKKPVVQPEDTLEPPVTETPKEEKKGENVSKDNNVGDAPTQSTSGKIKITTIKKKKKPSGPRKKIVINLNKDKKE